MLVTLDALKEQFGRAAEVMLADTSDAHITDSAVLDLANSTDVPVVLGRGTNRAFTWMTQKGVQFVAICSDDDAFFRPMLQHELIHVDQVKRGDLEMGFIGYYWKDEFYMGMETPVSPSADAPAVEQANFLLKTLKYMALPWELEASLPTLEIHLNHKLAPAIRELYERFGTTWKHEWSDDRFIEGVLVKYSLKDGIIAASGISY